MRAWGLPENICEVVEHHTKAQFVPAKALRTDHRAEIAVLYLSHLCHDHYAGNRQPVETFLGEYMSLLGFPAVSGTIFAKEKVLPVLLGGIKRFPEHVRNFIKKAASGGREPV